MENDVIVGGHWNILGKKFDGDLIYNKSNGNILLDIYYYDTKEFSAWYNKPIDITEITGYTNQKTKCILTDCKVIKRHTEFPARHHIVIIAKELFWGLNKRRKSSLKFNEIHFKLSNIFQWTKLNGFIELSRDPEYWLNLAYSPKKNVVIKIDDNTTVEFVPGMGAFNTDMLVEKINVSQFVLVKIKKEKAEIFTNFFTELDKVINLITLATNERINIQKIECVDYNYFYCIKDKKEFIKFEMISYKMKKEQLSERNNLIDILNYLYDLPVIMLDKKVENWFNNYDKYRNIYNLYLLGIKNDLPDEIKFCNLMQALELMHRIKFSKKRKFFSHIDVKFLNNNSIIKDIRSHKDQKQNGFIILRSRMIDILSNDFIDITDDIIKLADILTDSRNYYTHYDDSKRNKCVIKDNLKYSIYFLSVLTSCFILSELGFSNEYIKNKQEHNIEYINSKKMIKNIIDNGR